MTAVLEAEGIARRFGGLAAVDGVSLAVRPGTVVGLIGPNGAGKTTLVNVVSGHDRPTAGRVLVDGRELTGARPWSFARAGVARTFQVAKPFRALTVAENVATGAMHGTEPARSVRAALARAETVLAAVGLAERAGQRATELSVGEVRRLELARALAQRPRVLLLDEPLAGLRSSDIDAVLELVRSVREQGVAVLLVEHVVRAVFAVADEVLVLDQGRSLARGTPAEVAADERVIAAYLGHRYARRPGGSG